ncbi:uncharacterized protein T069G_10789 [Trichoderma breve]|uniref:Uncharacterized protein n=1 Tax=Trichoderma breve TaxID=2034170 RepID=A0A9W9E5B1_9HYPO|nr:uncharacterized protein T069G_10789 [Trichoderma breve]KAJ4855231.1 hypothetical protein T069G_10789 [Trichoderma breve]
MVWHGMAWHGMGTCVKVITTLELPSPVRPSLLALHLPQGASPAPVRQKQRRRSAAAKSNQRQKASDEPLLLGESRLRQPAKPVESPAIAVLTTDRCSCFGSGSGSGSAALLSSDPDGLLSLLTDRPDKN